MGGIEIDLSDVTCAYMREALDQDGKPEWYLLDQEGELIIATNNRSAVFFFAVEHDIPMMTVH